MNYEMTVEVGQHRRKIIMQNGFFEFKALTSALHRHIYGEIHTQISGESVYEIGGKTYGLCPGQCMYIPCEVFHKIVSFSKDAEKCAFQTDLALDTVTFRKLPKGMLSAFSQAVNDRSVNLMSGYLSVICAHFDGHADKSLTPISDREFIIREFFERRYDGDVTVKDLAGELGLSDKQTERLVTKYYGAGFRRVLSKRRADAAKKLLQTGNMSMAEISSAVGYRSYSGFWKAKKEFADP